MHSSHDALALVLTSLSILFINALIIAGVSLDAMFNLTLPQTLALAAIEIACLVFAFASFRKRAGPRAAWH